MHVRNSIFDCIQKGRISSISCHRISREVEVVIIFFCGSNNRLLFQNVKQVKDFLRISFVVESLCVSVDLVLTVNMATEVPHIPVNSYTMISSKEF